MRTKRLLLIAACLLGAVLLLLYFLHAHHKTEAASDCPCPRLRPSRLPLRTPALSQIN